MESSEEIQKKCDSFHFENIFIAVTDGDEVKIDKTENERKEEEKKDKKKKERETDGENTQVVIYRCIENNG